MEMLLNGKVLKYRNAARLLGGQKIWQKRIVSSCFGEEICNKALTCSQSELNAARLLLVNYFESKFTDDDKAMEIALKKAENPVYETEDDI
jgi:hypothetical protein